MARKFEKKVTFAGGSLIYGSRSLSVIDLIKKIGGFFLGYLVRTIKYMYVF